MKYMLLINPIHDLDVPEGASDISEWVAYSRAMAEAGVLLAGEPLVDPSEAVTLHQGDGTVVDGPYAESKEVLAGFYMIDVPDRDAALGWARRMPPAGRVEVRACAAFDPQV